MQLHQISDVCNYELALSSASPPLPAMPSRPGAWDPSVLLLPWLHSSSPQELAGCYSQGFGSLFAPLRAHAPKSTAVGGGARSESASRAKGKITKER